MLQTVLDELQARKGQWRDIARRLAPQAADQYYSWLTKVAQGTIADPSVNKIQLLYDYLRRTGLQVGAGETAHEVIQPHTDETPVMPGSPVGAERDAA